MDADEIVEAVRRYVDDGEIVSAVKLIEREIDSHADDPRLHFWLAYSLQGDAVDRRRVALDRALERGFDRPDDVRLVEAEIAWNGGEMEEVARLLDCEPPTDLDPVLVSDWTAWRASALGRLGDTSQADRLEQQSLDERNGGIAQFLLIEASIVLGTAQQTDELIARRTELLAKVREIAGDDDPVPGYWYQAYALALMGPDPQRVIDATDELISRDLGRTDGFVWFARVDGLAAVGRIDDALTEAESGLAEAAPSPFTDQLRIGYSTLLVLRQRFEEALAALDGIADLDSVVDADLREQVTVNRATALVGLSRHDEAIVSLSSLDALNPRRVDLEAVSLLASGRPADALSVIEGLGDAIDDSLVRSSLLASRGRAHLRLGNVDQAEADLTAATDGWPELMPRLVLDLELARVALHRGDPAQALKSLGGLPRDADHAMAIAVFTAATCFLGGSDTGPRDDKSVEGIAAGLVLSAAARELVDAGQREAALAALDAVASVEPDVMASLGWTITRATQLMGLQRFDEVIGFFDTVDDEIASTTDARFVRGMAFSAAGRIGDAWPIMRELDVEPAADDPAGAWAMSGLAALLLGRDDVALIRLDHAIEVEAGFRSNPGVLFGWGLACADEGRVDDARDAADALRDDWPWISETIDGKLAERDGDLDAAAAHLDAAADHATHGMDPVQGAMFRSYAAILRIRNADYELAADTADRCLDVLEGADGLDLFRRWIRFVRAWAWYLSDHADEALDEVERLSEEPVPEGELGPISGDELRAIEMTLHGLLLRDRGEIERAAELFQGAVELDDEMFSAELELAGVSIVLGDSETALASSERTVELAESATAIRSARLVRTRALRAAGRLGEALRLARLVLLDDAADSSALLELGRIHTVGGRHDAAANAFLRLWYEGSSARAAVEYSGALIRAGHAERAESWLRLNALPTLEREGASGAGR